MCFEFLDQDWKRATDPNLAPLFKGAIEPQFPLLQLKTTTALYCRWITDRQTPYLQFKALSLTNQFPIILLFCLCWSKWNSSHKQFHLLKALQLHITGKIYVLRNIFTECRSWTETQYFKSFLLFRLVSIKEMDLTIICWVCIFREFQLVA